MAKEPATPEDYIASLDEPRRIEVRKLQGFIRKTRPEGGSGPASQGRPGPLTWGFKAAGREADA